MVAQAVDSTMAEVGRDPYFDTYLKYYLPGSDKSIRELIR